MAVSADLRLFEKAWTAIRGGFVEMFKLAEQGSFDEIDAIQPLASANALRAKATYMYFPEELLPICSKDHLDHFLGVLGAPPREGRSSRPIASS